MRVLVVDDDKASAELTLELLHTAPEVIAECLFRAEQCLSKCREFMPDVLLLDMRMPIVDGVSVIQTLRRDPLFGALPIILLSAYVDSDYRLKAFEAGANDYIEKWPSRIDLLSSVRSYAYAFHAQMASDMHGASSEGGGTSHD
ncbi:response regulator [Noviherbaspirillum pedocola]|uniref:Response regulator n=1 Tax=Noviherbaspirillum pedocola TaxID=2801341 RepID=A0A934W797_9BURK|nr:response regulator [Noviherbaspirillum pedocola]MBK4735298.1 response regulator [Noviherbaspirillum pedocola]